MIVSTLGSVFRVRAARKIWAGVRQRCASRRQMWGNRSRRHHHQRLDISGQRRGRRARARGAFPTGELLAQPRVARAERAPAPPRPLPPGAARLDATAAIDWEWACRWNRPNEPDLSKSEFRVIVDPIQVDSTCGQYVAATDRGHRLVISLRAGDQRHLRFSVYGIPLYHKRSTIGTDGVTEPPPSSSIDCHEAMASRRNCGPA
jgi:hypothetical protein